MPGQWNHKVFGVKEMDFETLALEIFRFQAAQNTVYKAYLQALGADPASVKAIEQIPFLPVRFFKSHMVQTTSFEAAVIFESSGTTGTIGIIESHRIGCSETICDDQLHRGNDLALIGRCGIFRFIFFTGRNCKQEHCCSGKLKNCFFHIQFIKV